MTPDQEFHLLQTVTKIGSKMDMLVSDDGGSGQVPALRMDHDKLKQHVTAQISYWKGAIAVVSFFILVFGALLVAHILGGKQQ